MTLGLRASSAVVVTHSKAANRKSANAIAWKPDMTPLPKRANGVSGTMPGLVRATIDRSTVPASTVYVTIDWTRPAMVMPRRFSAVAMTSRARIHT